jgi:hypothetical protein
MKDIPGIFVLDVLNCTTSLNGSDSKTRRVAKTRHNTCLPLQRARNRLVNLGRILQVDHVDMALSSCDDQQLVFHIHAVHALLRIQRTDGFRAFQVPELDCLVPRAGCNVVITAGLEPAHAFDGLGMGFCLLRRDLSTGGGGTEVNDVEVAGRIAGGYTSTILSKSVNCVL